MGLNAMPQLLPSRYSTPEMAKNDCKRGTVVGRDSKSRNPVRGDHPQEAELQRFKQEFAAKQQLDEMKRQLEEKKRKVRATLDKARLALSQGIIASPKLGKFEDSKEFLEALEFLQCNKDFIFQFLEQKPHAVFSNDPPTTTVTTPAKKGKLATQAIQAAKVTSYSTQRGFSPRSLARLFMPSESRKGNDQVKLNPKPGIENRVAQSPTAVQRLESSVHFSDDVKRKTPSSTSSRYMLPTSPKSQVKNDGKGVSKKTSARDVIADIKERLRRREQQPDVAVQCTSSLRNLQNSQAYEPPCSPKTTNFTLTESLSTGKRISMLRPDLDTMSGSEETSTPKAVLTDYSTDSPATLRAQRRKTQPQPSSVRASESCHQKPKANRRNGKPDSPRKKHLLHPVNDAASSPSLARCRSVPNAAMLREHKDCTPAIDVARNATTPKETKPARHNQNGAQSGGERILSVGRKKRNTVGQETTPEIMSALPSPSRAAALAESCTNARSKDGNASKTKVRRNILDNVIGSRVATRDKNGLNSPASVLEPPFQEFQDITNAHQDPLRIRSRRPKWEGGRESVRNHAADTTRETHPRPPSAALPPPSPPRPRTPPTPASDFAFVRDVLVASGFHTHGGRNLTHWHSSTQPITPRLLKKMQTTRARGSCRHRLLFDAVNEVLLAALERSAAAPVPHCYGLPVVVAAARGRRVVEDVWGEIRKRERLASFASCGDRDGDGGKGRGGRDDARAGLASLVAMEVEATGAWLALRRDVDRIGEQVEKAVWEDMVEEVCMELLAVK